MFLSCPTRNTLRMPSQGDRPECLEHLQSASCYAEAFTWGMSLNGSQETYGGGATGMMRPFFREPWIRSAGVMA